MPMGGQIGTTVEIAITGENIEDVDDLRFSHRGLIAEPKLDDNGQPVPNTYLVSITDDCPAGIHEARAMTRLGVSSSRVFNVSSLPENHGRPKPNTSLETAMAMQVNSICNSVMTKQSIDYYSFEAEQGQRIIVDCAAQGIDSKLKPVLIIADQKRGRPSCGTSRSGTRFSQLRRLAIT